LNVKKKYSKDAQLDFVVGQILKNIAFLGQKWPKIIYFPDKY
jgi:hypothetical protein